MILQLHWLYRDGHSEFRAQADINSPEDLYEWVKGVKERHPLPKDCEWLCCDETSPNFMRAARAVGGN